MMYRRPLPWCPTKKAVWRVERRNHERARERTFKSPMLEQTAFRDTGVEIVSFRSVTWHSTEYTWGGRRKRAHNSADVCAPCGAPRRQWTCDCHAKSRPYNAVGKQSLKNKQATLSYLVSQKRSLTYKSLARTRLTLDDIDQVLTGGGLNLTEFGSIGLGSSWADVGDVGQGWPDACQLWSKIAQGWGDVGRSWLEFDQSCTGVDQPWPDVGRVLLAH